MEMIHVDTDIQLRDAFSQFEIDTERDIELTFSADAGEYEDLYVSRTAVNYVFVHLLTLMHKLNICSGMTMNI